MELFICSFFLSFSYESFKLSVSAFQDGLFIVNNNLNLVEGNPLAILTPNVYEYKRLVQKVLNCDVDEETASEQLIALCQK
jgi:NAD(P)H-hydrate repair Nnr-like enzyme with NAD(P)H-hydrate dehydratase domain